MRKFDWLFLILSVAICCFAGMNIYAAEETKDVVKNAVCKDAKREAELIAKLRAMQKHAYTTWQDKDFDALYVEAKKAYAEMPNSPEIALRLACLVHENNHFDPVESLMIALPFVNRKDANSQVPFQLWQLFSTAECQNILALEKWDEVFKDYPIKTKQALLIMKRYWATQINQSEFKQSKRSLEEINQDMTSFTEKEKKLAPEIWSHIVKRIAEIKAKRLAEEERVKEFKAVRDSYNKHLQDAAAERKIQFENDMKKLDEFEKGPNDFPKMEKIFLSLRQYRNHELAAAADIPNFEKLKKSYPNSLEAEILNFAYKAYVKLDYKNCSAEIDKVKDYKKNLRLLTIKLYCLKQSESSFKEVMPVLDDMLALDPNNEQAFMIKKMIQAQDELKNQKSNDKK